MAGLPCAFSRRVVLLGRQHLRVSRPEVGVAQALLVPLGDAAPQHAASGFAAASDGTFQVCQCIRHDLAGSSALGQPHPALVLIILVLAEPHEGPRFIEFKNIAFLGLRQRCLQGRQLRGFLIIIF